MRKSKGQVECRRGPGGRGVENARILGYKSCKGKKFVNINTPIYHQNFINTILGCRHKDCE